MSHTTTISSIALVSQSAIRGAISDLKSQGIRCELLEKATPRAYYKDQPGMGEADFVIQLQDSRYDVGLYRNNKGQYEARADLFAGEISRVLGAERSSDDVPQEQAALGKFFQAYTTRAVEEQASNEGYIVNRSMNADGSVVLNMVQAA